jgi:hypothetical protein
VVSRHPNEWFLTSDLLDDYGTMSHTSANSAKWNLAYVDGHAGSFEDRDLYEKFTVQKLRTSQDWLLYNQWIRPEMPGSDVKMH